ncbi:MAG: outer membrane beta-barrel protein [Gemmatimonadota bacterium]
MSRTRSKFGYALAAGVLASAALGSPSSALAQARPQITPYFASFYAISPYVKDLDEGSGTLFNEKETNAPAIGVRVSFGITRAIGIEGSIAYANAGRQASISHDSSTVQAGFFIKGNLLMASGRLTFHPRRSNFRGIVGVGYEKRGGAAWDTKNFTAGTKFDKSDIGGILGFGVKASVTPKFALDLDIEAFLHSSDPLLTGKSQFQQDILVAIGVPISLSGH